MIYIGTSGFSYDEWKGIFYPEDLPKKGYLEYYGTQFPTTEINNTFYRSPKPEVVQAWRDAVPDDFRFAMKMTQRVTHRKRLSNVEEEMEWFLRGAEAMEPKLACILVQLPPWFKQDLEILNDFLRRYAPKAPLTLEFRHDSWFQENTYQMLERHGVPLAVVEADDRPALRRVTGSFVYSRLRKVEYADGDLSDWAEWFSSLSVDAFVYLKHAASAPQLARQLRDGIAAT